MCNDIDHLVDRQQLFVIEDVAQLPALQEFHRDIGDVAATADVVDGDDIGMTQTTGSLGLLVESRLVLLALFLRKTQGDGLDRNDAVYQRVGCLVNDPHRPLTEFADNLITPQMTDHISREE